MAKPTWDEMGRNLQRFAWLVAGALAFSLALPSVAVAHTSFESSDPTDQTTVTGDLSEITITFTGPAEPTGEGFVILDSNGTVRTPASFESNADSNIWTLAFDEPLQAGPIGVRWTVVAPDAHPISGSFSFTIESVATPEPESSVTLPNRDSDGTQATAGTSDPAVDKDQALKEFLAPPDEPAHANSVATTGRFLSFGGVILAIGALVFVGAIVADRPSDVAMLLSQVRAGGLLTVVGTLAAIASKIAVENNSWTITPTGNVIDAVFTSESGLAASLRASGGLLLFSTARLAPSAPSMTKSQEADRKGVSQHSFTKAFSWPPLLAGTTLGTALLLTSFTSEGHTVTEGNRWVTGLVDMVHVLAASVWAGGLVAFATVLWSRRRRRTLTECLPLAVRFSVIAGAALALTGLAGVALAATIIEQMSDLWLTSWGRTLLAKTAVVAVAATLGAYNHFVLVPQIADGRLESTGLRLRRVVTMEAAAMLVVIALTAVLVGAST